MSGFDVLDPNLPIFKSHFIEASAGTGKTFTIENIVLRLLLEPNGPTIDQILVVTFTKKATFELKSRILSRIEKTLFEIQDPSSKKRLKNALILFEEAKIFTIHGFCFFALKEFSLESGFFLDEKEKNASLQACFPILKDFLRTQLKPEILHVKQVDKILKLHKNDIDLLLKKLTLLANVRVSIKGGRPFFEIKKELSNEIRAIKNTFSIEKEKLEADLLFLAPYFGKLATKQKSLKEEVVKGIEKFASLFEEENADFIDSPLLKMVPENRLKKELPKEGLFYPHLIGLLQKKLFPLLEEASNPLSILGCLAEEARFFLEKVVEKKELIFFEDLLRKMEKAIENNAFSDGLRKCFRAVLIDEFQDTDPIQWRIFSKLFRHPTFSGPLYLVGDPKQSIYNFRGADVYTYLEAKKSMGKENEATLVRNFRSDPGLASSLNVLFSKDFLLLPKTGEKIECPPIVAGISSPTSFSDGKGNVHFMLGASEALLFLHISNEILKLHEEEKIPLGEIAVLVKDRFQAKRFADFVSFPISMKEHQPLGETEAFFILYDLLIAVLNPHNRSFVARACGSAFFNLQNEDLEEGLYDFSFYHEVLEKEGIFSLFQAMMQKSSLNDEKIYTEMLQIVELLAKNAKSEEEILPFLQEMKKMEETEEFKVRTIEEKNAVQVMTIHVSKGLEFAVVFPIGLSLSNSKKTDFVREGNQFVLKENREEEEAEKMRQLYVALTRAKKRVYLPLIEGEENAPLSLFLKGREIEALCKEHPEMTWAPCEKTEKKVFEKVDPPPLLSPSTPKLQFPALSIYSYSSLVHKEMYFEHQGSETTGLPGGAETGILLHRLFERVPFDKGISAKELLPFIMPILQGTHLETWISHISDLMFQVLTLPFVTTHSRFALKDLPSTKIKKELEFLFPGEIPKGFCKGFIDLFFEYEGYFYFLDWKSNDLNGDYSEKRMRLEMEQQQYGMQAKIYSEAIKKYLRLFNKEHLFGGFFYVFLRGPTYLYFSE